MSCLCCCILGASCFISWSFTVSACLSVIRTCCRAIKCRKFAGSRMGNTRTYCMYHVDFQQFYCVVISAFTLYWKLIKSNPLFLHCWRFGVYQRPKRQQCKNNGLFWRILLLWKVHQPTEPVLLLQSWLALLNDLHCFNSDLNYFQLSSLLNAAGAKLHFISA